MSFFPTPQKRLVPGIGPKDAKILIVGEYTTAYDDKSLRPFSGPDGSVLEACLHQAKLIRGIVRLTNCFKSKSVAKNYKEMNLDFFEPSKKKFTQKGLEHVELLWEEVREIKPNVIVAAGDAALQALTGLRSAAKYRGYVCESHREGTKFKVIPTISPAVCVRQYVARHLIAHDLQKAKQESEVPQVIRPARNLIYEFSSCMELLQWIEIFEKAEVVSFDIEVVNFEVAAVSFSNDKGLGVAIPIGNCYYKPRGWTEEEELQIWRAIQRVLENPVSKKVAQNGIFDIQFLYSNIGIQVKGEILDTMIAHHVMFPDLPKGLAFLGSLYCGSQEYWKDAVDFDDIKGES